MSRSRNPRIPQARLSQLIRENIDASSADVIYRNENGQLVRDDVEFWAFDNLDGDTPVEVFATSLGILVDSPKTGMSYIMDANYPPNRKEILSALVGERSNLPLFEAVNTLPRLPVPLSGRDAVTRAIRQEADAFDEKNVTAEVRSLLSSPETLGDAQMKYQAALSSMSMRPGYDRSSGVSRMLEEYILEHIDSEEGGREDNPKISAKRAGDLLEMIQDADPDVLIAENLGGFMDLDLGAGHDVLTEMEDRDVGFYVVDDGIVITEGDDIEDVLMYITDLDPDWNEELIYGDLGESRLNSIEDEMSENQVFLGSFVEQVLAGAPFGVWTENREFTREDEEEPFFTEEIDGELRVSSYFSEGYEHVGSDMFTLGELPDDVAEEHGPGEGHALVEVTLRQQAQAFTPQNSAPEGLEQIIRALSREADADDILASIREFAASPAAERLSRQGYGGLPPLPARLILSDIDLLSDAENQTLTEYASQYVPGVERVLREREREEDES